MKANELMIGDWVHVKPAVTKRIEFDKQVIGIGEDVILIKKDSGVDNIVYDRVLPIPLTREILEVNGAEIKEASDGNAMYAELKLADTKFLSYHFYEGRIRIWSGIAIEIDGGGNNYIHNLQQAIRFCGLPELADNFKIQ